MVDAIGPDARTSTLDAPEEQRVPSTTEDWGQRVPRSTRRAHDTASAGFRLHLWPRPPSMGVHDHVGDLVDGMRARGDHPRAFCRLEMLAILLLVERLCIKGVGRRSYAAQDRQRNKGGNQGFHDHSPRVDFFVSNWLTLPIWRRRDLMAAIPWYLWRQP
jgi:hypothetical protein